MPDAFENMDRMYRFQRHFYDFTRKYYLLGRDRLLAELDIRQSERVLEIGCGTGRNLIILAKRYPEAHFYGLDASTAMLDTAHSKIDAGNISNIALRTALADGFSFDKTFDLKEQFDKIFFSYSISIIPMWRESIENALKNLKPGGSFFIVDFFDQRDLPNWIRIRLQNWLRRFHVGHPPDLIPFLKDMDNRGFGKHALCPLYRRYAFISSFTRNEQRFE